LMAAAEKLLYEPPAIAYHPVHQNRMQRSFFLRWHFDFGRTMVRLWEPAPDVLEISRHRFTLLKLIAASLPCEFLRWVVNLNPQRRFLRKCWVWATAGQIIEIYRKGNQRQAH
jgi:hypothetical protein